jgi:predicted nucleotidyltransferase
MFKTITEDLQKELKRHFPQIRLLLKKNPAIAYKRIGEIGKDVGKKYNINLLVNFPHEGKIDDFDMYGKQDLSFLIDMEKRTFPIDRSIIKEKAKEILGDVKTVDAYMYEDKEGCRIIFGDNIQDKIDILPHSLHIWYEFTEPVTEFCEWLLENVYLLKQENTNL